MSASTGRGWSTADTAAVALLALVALWTAHGFLHPDRYPLGHDQPAHMMRMAAFDTALRDGQLPPIWAGDFYYGYGGPVFGFYPTLLYYLAEPAVLAGADVLVALRLVLVLATVGTAWLMYGWLRRRCGWRGALVGGILVTLAPYHLLDLYVRAAYTEYAAFACGIAMFWSAQAWMEGAARRAWFALVLATAGMVGLHLGSIVMLGPLTALWLAGLAGGRRPPVRRLLLGWAALAAALALTVGDWLPAFMEKGDYQIDAETQGGYFVYSDHFLNLRELVVPDWGFGISRPDDADEHTSFQLGLVHWAALPAGALALLLGPRRRWTAALFAVGAVSLLMTLPGSRAVWARFSVLQALQFPWRFLLPAVLATSALAGVSVGVLGARPLLQGSVAALWCVAAVLAYGPYRTAFFYGAPIPSSSRELLAQLRPTGLGRPEYRPAGLSWEPPGVPVASALPLNPAAARVTMLEERGHRLRFIVQADQPVGIAVERFAGPGWRATVNGRAVPLSTDPRRRTITLTVPAGESAVTVRYGLTPLRRNALACGAIAALGLAALWRKWPRAPQPITTQVVANSNAQG